MLLIPRLTELGVRHIFLQQQVRDRAKNKIFLISKLSVLKILIL